MTVSTSNSFVYLFDQAIELRRSENPNDRLMGAAILKWLYQCGERLVVMKADNHEEIKNIMDLLKKLVEDI